MKAGVGVVDLEVPVDTSVVLHEPLVVALGHEEVTKKKRSPARPAVSVLFGRGQLETSSAR